MKKENDRRDFIKKVTAVTAVSVIGMNSGAAKNEDEKEPVPEIKNIKPLGFQWKTKDPFLFCVHHEDFYPKGNEKLGPAESLEGREIGQDFLIKDGWRMYHGKNVPGFPGHPHRGFETITVVRKGMVDHSDSMGASGRYGDGDVQWMTAGKGIQHAEMFPLINQNDDNPMELFQIWLNLPKVNKMVDPHYKMIWGESIPKYTHRDYAGKITAVEIIAGKIDQHRAINPPPDSWAGLDENEVAIWNIQMDAGAKWTLPKASDNVNRTIYFYKGEELKVAGEVLENYHSADVEAGVPIILESGNEKSYILILQGKPIGEPVVQHGPFVMNTKQEIQQAFADYQKTQFGGWPWPVRDPVHPKNKGRFASHANGKVEIKG